MIIPEGKECYRHGPRICGGGNLSSCIAFCQDACKKFDAGSKCLADETCFCNCCYVT